MYLHFVRVNAVVGVFGQNTFPPTALREHVEVVWREGRGMRFLFLSGKIGAEAMLLFVKPGFDSKCSCVLAHSASKRGRVFGPSNAKRYSSSGQQSFLWDFTSCANKCFIDSTSADVPPSSE